MKRTILQFSKFGIIGISNTAIDLVVYSALTRGISFFGEHYLVAAFISFVVSGINGYYWSRKWTFKHHSGRVHKTTTRQIVKFYIASAIALVLNQGFLYLFIEYAEILSEVAKVLSGMSAGIVNFLLQKLWTFSYTGDFDEHEGDETIV